MVVVVYDSKYRWYITIFKMCQLRDVKRINRISKTKSKNYNNYFIANNCECSHTVAIRLMQVQIRTVYTNERKNTFVLMRLWLLSCRQKCFFVANDVYQPSGSHLHTSTRIYNNESSNKIILSILVILLTFKEILK